MVRTGALPELERVVEPKVLDEDGEHAMARNVVPRDERTCVRHEKRDVVVPSLHQVHLDLRVHLLAFLALMPHPRRAPAVGDGER